MDMEFMNVQFHVRCIMKYFRGYRDGSVDKS